MGGAARMFASAHAPFRAGPIPSFCVRWLFGCSGERRPADGSVARANRVYRIHPLCCCFVWTMGFRRGNIAMNTPSQSELSLPQVTTGRPSGGGASARIQLESAPPSARSSDERQEALGPSRTHRCEQDRACRDALLRRHRGCGSHARRAEDHRRPVRRREHARTR